MVLTDENVLEVAALVFTFSFLFMIGLRERFAMIAAAIVSVFMALRIGIMTDSPYLFALFIFIMALCIGIAITKKK